MMKNLNHLQLQLLAKSQKANNLCSPIIFLTITIVYCAHRYSFFKQQLAELLFMQFQQHV